MAMGRGSARPTNRADELHLDACVLQSLAILWAYCDLALDRLSVQVQRDLFFPVLVELDVHGLALVEFLEDDVDVDGRGEEVGHGGRAGAVARGLFTMQWGDVGAGARAGVEHQQLSAGPAAPACSGALSHP